MGVLWQRVGGWLGRFREDFLETEKPALIYWSAVLYGVGIALYFSFSFEPKLWPVLAALAGLFAGQALIAGKPLATLAVRALMIVLLGLASGIVRTAMNAHQALARETGPVLVEGRLAVVEERLEDGLRLTLTDVRYQEGGTLPDKIRITVKTDAPKLYPGMIVTARAILLPLPEPVIPGGYDFARQLWFEGFGAVGFAVSAVTISERPPVTWGERIERWRRALAARITAAARGPEGGIAAALVTGIRDAIPDAVSDDMRIAGLAHLLAISGLHMALVTGFLYLLFRSALALIPRLALNYPVRKFAAAAAFLGALGYLLLSGAGLSTQRAFIMVSIVLLAIITDRRAISMRLVALAAIVVLTLSPEALLHPSFQMSFAAVTGLVAGYGRLKPRLTAMQQANPGPLGRARLYVVGVIVSTVIAELTIGPIALYHFGRFATFGLLANLIAVPVMGLIVMPAGIVALILIPFGLDGYLWQVMAAAIGLIIDVAATIAALPGADLRLPGLPQAALGLFAGGGLWLVLWRTPALKRLAAVPLVAALVLSISHVPPDALIDREGRLVALKGPDGHYYFSTLKAAAFSRDNWLRARGQREARGFDAFPGGGSAGLACDPLGCLYVKAGVRLAYVLEPAAFGEDCQRAGVIVTAHYAPFPCKDRNVVVDRAAITRNGAHALWLDDGVRVVSVGETRGSRPWTRADQ